MTNISRFGLLLLLSCFTLAASAQVKRFDVLLLGKKIGTTTVERSYPGTGQVQYRLRSSSTASVLWVTNTSELDFDVLYNNGVMTKSTCTSVKNEVKEVTSIIWDELRYVIKKGKQLLSVNEPVAFSAIQLYYTEPLSITRIFSERLGMFCTFEKSNTGEYKCVVDDVTSYYRYRNGTLYEVEMSKPLGSVYMRLVK